jgi:hypothetical protein
MRFEISSLKFLSDEESIYKNTMLSGGKGTSFGILDFLLIEFQIFCSGSSNR